MNASFPIPQLPKQASTLARTVCASFGAMLLWAGPASAAEHRPSTNDLWDISQGVTIATSSPVQGGFDARDTFGGTFSSGEPNTTVFADSMPAGYVHFIEWQTPQPVTVGSFVLFAAGDGPVFSNQREFSQFVLKAKSAGSGDFDLVLYTYPATHPYSYVDTTNFALIAAEVSPVTAQAFRAEFIQYTSGGGFDGPRIMELDGYAPDCVSAPAGLVSWWRGEGNANDTAGTNHGAAENGLTFASGMVDQAFSFDGTDDYVRIGAAASLDVGLSAGMTLEGWIRPSNPQATGPLIEWNDGISTIGVHLWLNAEYPPGMIRPLYVNLVDTQGGIHVIGTTSGALMSNAWQHVAVTYDKASGAAVLYLDGAVVLTESLGSFTPLTSYPLWFGKRPAGGGSWLGPYQGLMDEVGLYDRALSTVEIQAIFAAGSAGKCPPPPPTAPEITVHPASQRIPEGGDVTFQVTAIGAPPLSYQWYLSTNVIADATNDVLMLTNIQADAEGGYRVMVSNAFGVATSAVAQLTLTFPPVITVQPQGQTVVIGARVVFSVTAVGAEPLAYQWRRNGISVAGGTGQILILNNIQPTQAGTYTVRVSNTDGSTISASAVLRVGAAQLGLGITGEGPRLDVVGQTNVTYLIQTSSDLVNWTTLATEVSPPINWSFTDPTAAGVERRFYRLRRTP